MKEKTHIYDEFVGLRGDLLRYAESLFNSAADAEDAVQDLYVKLLEKKDSLAEVASPIAYCKTMLKNICLDRLRSASVKNRSDMPEGISSPTAAADVVLDDKTRLGAAVKEIDCLPKGQKTVVVKNIWGGRSYEEIAEETGMSGQTVRTQMSLARKTLRSRLAWAFAAVAVAVTIGLYVSRPAPLVDTFDDPALAYAEVEKAFARISGDVNKGMAVVEKASPVFDKVNSVFNPEDK